jgi:hypothetical protein
MQESVRDVSRTAVPCTAIGCNKHCQKCWKSQQFVQAYGERLATSRRQEIDASFVPVVQAAGLAVHATVNTIPGHRSAANIAESLLVTAHDVGADIMVVCSHGGCAAPARASCRKCECCWLPALPRLLALTTLCVWHPARVLINERSCEGRMLELLEYMVHNHSINRKHNIVYSSISQRCAEASSARTALWRATVPATSVAPFSCCRPTCQTSLTQIQTLSQWASTT